MTQTPRRALVTDGTKGIGLAVVRRLAREGHSVVAVHSGDDASGEVVARDLGHVRHEVQVEQMDLGQPEQMLALFRRLEDEARTPELLVNTVGLVRGPIGPSADLTFEEVIHANLNTTFLTCRQAVKAMTRLGFGRIVNFAWPKLVGEDTPTAQASVNLSLVGFTQSLAREVARFGVTANVVATGLIQTEMTALPATQQLEALIGKRPVRRAGTADEVAGLVNMLCGEDAGYITGQCLSIDGGLS